MVDLRRGDFGEKLSLLHLIADIDIALGDIAAGAREDIGGREGRRRAGQRHQHGGVARLDRGCAHCRHEVLAHRGIGHRLARLRVIAPGAEGDTRTKQEKNPNAEQPPDSSAAGFSPHPLGVDAVLSLNRCHVIHADSSSKTPCACLPSLPLRKVANR